MRKNTFLSCGSRLRKIKMLISGFPGVGKTRASKIFNALIDLDSMQYVNRPKYPYCYMYDAIHLSKKGYIVLIAQEPRVVELMVMSGEDYVIVCPDISLKNEYMLRYLNRGNADAWIDKAMASWENHLNKMKEYPRNNIIILKSGQYLTDVMTDIQIRKGRKKT